MGEIKAKKKDNLNHPTLSPKRRGREHSLSQVHGPLIVVTALILIIAYEQEVINKTD